MDSNNYRRLILLVRGDRRLGEAIKRSSSLSFVMIYRPAQVEDVHERAILLSPCDPFGYFSDRSGPPFTTLLGETVV